VLTGLIIDNGIEAVDTAAVDFGLIFPTIARMDLVLLGVNFAPSGLNKNETAIGNNLTKIYEAGSGDLVSLLDALAALPKIGDLANALDQLSPELYLDTEIATLFSSQMFASSLMTCPVREGAAAFIKEGQCVWARLSGRDFDQDQTFQTFGFDERSYEVAGGLQGALGEVWRLGFAGAYEESFLDTTTNASSDADRVHGGAVLKYNPGKLLLAGAVSGGWGWYDTERPINFPGFFAFARSDQEIGYVNGRFRAEYQLGSGTWYAKPLVDFDATHIRLDGVTETGAGAVNLIVRGADETILSATPAIELGAQFGNPTGTLVRPYLRGGATFYDDPEFVLLASFEGAPSGIGPFRIASATDDVIGMAGAGVDVIGTDGTSFRLYYEGRFSDLVEQHAGGIKATLPF
jgi:outer membrane autotransporter protein